MATVYRGRITAKTIEAEAQSSRKLRSTLDRWRRSKTGWSERGMLTDAIIAHFRVKNPSTEERIAAFYAAKKVAETN